jgi:hypothetical protein
VYHTLDVGGIHGIQQGGVLHTGVEEGKEGFLFFFGQAKLVEQFQLSEYFSIHK